MLERRVVALILILIALAILLPPIASLSKWIAGGIVVFAAILIPFISKKLPHNLDGGFKRHHILSLLWVLIGIVGVFQMARLSIFMADPSKVWGSAVPDPAAVEHQCMSAYVQAADLSRRGEKNIYAESFYPAFSLKPDGTMNKIVSPISGLSGYLQDPFQYPPPFLLLPRAALAVTNNFLIIRTFWFVFQALTLCVCMFYLALWLGEKTGSLTILLIPALLGSLPMMLNFQFGQFHAMAIILALGAMVAFEKRHLPIGGALLAFSILAKLFPGVLLVYLVAQRRWREIVWTFIFAALFILLGVAILGIAPFQAFFSFELPRFMNGQAFSFVDREGVPLFVKARNYSIHGMITKFTLLGFSGVGTTVTFVAEWIYTFILLGLTVFAARKHNKNSFSNVQIWIALLILASLRTPVAPSAYVTAPVLFLLCLVASEVQGRFKYGLMLFVFWTFIMGLPPMPDIPEIIFDFVGQGLTIAVCVWVLVRKPRDIMHSYAIPSNRGSVLSFSASSG
jgi:hypothetical protein